MEPKMVKVAYRPEDTDRPRMLLDKYIYPGETREISQRQWDALTDRTGLVLVPAREKKQKEVPGRNTRTTSNASTSKAVTQPEATKTKTTEGKGKGFFGNLFNSGKSTEQVTSPEAEGFAMVEAAQTIGDLYKVQQAFPQRSKELEDAINAKGTLLNDAENAERERVEAEAIAKVEAVETTADLNALREEYPQPSEALAEAFNAMAALLAEVEAGAGEQDPAGSTSAGETPAAVQKPQG